MENAKDTKINSILKFLKDINVKIQESKAKGIEFNIFSVMGVQTEEVKLHSALLAELLDPKGSHGQGDYFIKLFLKECCKKYTNIKWDNAEVNVEVSIGPISEDLTTGGRLDILISSLDNNIGIAIENKIYAEDQEKQLDRYFHYLKENYNNYELFYLTLDGHEASKNSASEETVYSCISYSGSIINWLETSIEEPNIPENVKETIKQYIDVLKYLTGKRRVEEMNDNEKQSIINKLLEDNNLVLFEEYSSLVIEAKNVLFKKMIEALHELEDNDLKLKYSTDVDFSCKETGFDFIYKNKVTFSFVFNSSNFNQLYYGITLDKIPDDMKIPNSKITMKTTPAWYCWDYFNKEFCYLTTQKLLNFANQPKPFVDAIKNAIKTIKEQIKDY